MLLLSPLSIFVLASRSLRRSDALAQRARLHARIPPSNMDSSTKQQVKYKRALECPFTRLVVASGPAGTGKTFMAVAHAIRALQEKEYDKIVLTRPTVTVESESLGFLPGDINGKMLPFILPVCDVLQTGKKSALAEVQAMLSSGIIEVVPLAFVRGRTFKNSFIICDEMQNSTPTQMKAVLTRLGQGSKIVVTGDPGQQDLDIDTKSGFCDLVSRLSDEPSSKKINFIQLGTDDVQRDVFVKDILRMYE